jgi:Transcriptional regulator
MQQRAIDSKNKLLDSAKDLFSRKGFYNTNTKEISKNAGISIGNFYNLFESKYDIYFFLVQEHTKYVYDNISATLSKMQFLNPTDLKKELYSYILHSYEIMHKLGYFFQDMDMIAKDNENYLSFLNAESQKLIQLLQDFLLSYPHFHLRLTPQVTAHILYTILNDGVLHIRSISDTTLQREYLHGLATTVETLIFAD